MNWTKEECIKSFIELAESCPDKTITRDFFRKNSDCPESYWSKYFGTFSEFRTQVGLKLTNEQNRLLSNIAKHASKDKLREFNIEKQEYNDKYLRPCNKKYQTILSIGDTHDLLFDQFTKRVFLDSINRIKPETIVLGGDLFDLPEFSKYYNDPRNYRLLERIESVHSFLNDIRENVPNAEINYIAGNHECIEENTEVLTYNGWKLAKDLWKNDLIASYDNNFIIYNEPIGIEYIENQPLLHINGSVKDELVSENHKIIVDNKLVYAKEFLNSKIEQNRFTYFCTNFGWKILALYDYEIKLITWVVMAGTLVFRNGKINRIEFKLSRQDKIDNLTQLLDLYGIGYTIKECKKSKTNKLQSYYIRIYGEYARYIVEILLDNKKQLPRNFRCLNEHQLNIFLEELCIIYGYKRENGIEWNTTNKHDVDVIQMACINNGIHCYFNIKECKTPYNVIIGETIIKKCTVESKGYGNVVAIQTKDGTLITRRNGKVAFTGNCRLFKHLSNATPNILVLLNDFHGFTISSLLGLDKYQINYISREDLTYFNESELKKELLKNYLVKYDCILFHHFPEGKKYGLPGINFHHHSHHVYNCYNLTYGPYEWHQNGAGHIRYANFCDGSKWTNGFMISHHDIFNKRTVFEYIDTTQNFAIVGGKFYTRNENEIIK